MEEIEQREAKIMQHVRTAGIMKSKELQLLQELSELRKDRRREFARMIEEIDLLKDDVNAYRNEVSARDLKILEAQTRLDAVQKQSEKAQIEVRDRVSRAAKEQLSLLQQRYEAKLRALDAKLQEIATAQKKKLSDDLNAQVDRLRTAAESEAENRSKAELFKLQQSLVAAAEREKALKDLNDAKDAALSEVSAQKM